MNIDLIYQSLEDEKECRDALNIDYFSKDDYAVCNYILEHIPNIKTTFHFKKSYHKNSAIKESIKQLKILNEENYQELVTIIKNAKLIKDAPLHCAAVATSFDFKDDIISKKGKTIAYHLPKKIYIDNIISITHEHCHALKDSNYLEYKSSLITGEVIPIFSELIDYDTNIFKEKHLKLRMLWLKEQKSIYLALKDIISNQSIHEFSKSYYSTYITNFYYAIILYNLYKQEPIKILNLVNDVLSHKITTLDMLNKLNIYCNIQEEPFENEIINIAKVLIK